MKKKVCEDERCSQCEKRFTDGEEVVYHREVGVYFCNDECANEYDKQFRTESMNSVTEIEDENDEDEEIAEDDIDYEVKDEKEES